MDAAAPGSIAEQYDRRAGAAMPPIVAGDSPEEALLGAPSAGIEHRGGGLVHEDALRRGQVLAHVPGDRLEMEAGPTRPVAERRPVEPSANVSRTIGVPLADPCRA